jgi:uncharacterized membrane protein YeiH
VLMGVVTAVFGGVLRDIVCNDIPRVFSDHRPYAICAFIGGWVLIACDTLGVGQSVALGASALTATGIRVVAMYCDWKIPSWRTEE